MNAHWFVVLGRRFGLEVRRYHPPGPRRQDLLHRHQIGLVIDVGANVGEYGSELREFGYSGAIVSIEPLEGAFRRLEIRASAESDWQVRRVALGAADGTAELHVASNAASSSLLPMLDSHRRAAPGVVVTGTETVEVRRLDSLGLAVDRPTLLKLDVQGYEDRVLTGAQGVLDHVVLIECELSVEPLYESQRDLHSMLDLLAELGFRLALLEPAGRDPAGAVPFYNGLLRAEAEHLR